MSPSPGLGCVDPGAPLSVSQEAEEEGVQAVVEALRVCSPGPGWAGLLPGLSYPLAAGDANQPQPRVLSESQRGSAQEHGGGPPCTLPSARGSSCTRVLGDSSTPDWVLAPLLGEKPLSLRAQNWRLSVFSRKPEAFAPKDPGLCHEHCQSHGGDVGVSWKPSPSSAPSWFRGRTLISSRTLKCLILHCF